MQLITDNHSRDNSMQQSNMITAGSLIKQSKSAAFKQASRQDTCCGRPSRPQTQYTHITEHRKHYEHITPAFASHSPLINRAELKEDISILIIKPLLIKEP